MKALVIAPQPFFAPRGTPFSVYYRTLIAAEQGVDVDVLAYGEGEDVDIPGVRVIRIPRFPFLSPVRIGPSFPKLFLDLWMILWTVGLLLRDRYDFVHAHEEAVFWCRYLKPLFRFKLAYDMHSSLPQQLANFRFSSSELLVRTFCWLERAALRNSDAVITICPALESYARSHGVEPQRLFLIENSIFDDVRLAGANGASHDHLAGLEHSAPVGNGAAAPEHDPRAAAQAVHIIYAGTFEVYQGVDLLVRAFARVQRQRPEARLLLVGGRAEQIAALRALAESLGVALACRFTGPVPKAVARQMVETADVLVSPRVCGTNTPFKIYEQLASGKPLVATRIASHTQVLSEDVCLLVEPEEDDLARGLLQALSEPELAARLARNARRLYESAYSRARYEDKMRRFLEVLQ